MAVKKTTKKSSKRVTAAAAEETLDKGTYSLRLYVAGQTPKSIAAFANLKKH